jgi:hypothetical protein
MNRKNLRNTKKTTNFSTNDLKQLANTKKLKNILYKYIEKETIPSVRNAWIDYFFEIKKI